MISLVNFIPFCLGAINLIEKYDFILKNLFCLVGHKILVNVSVKLLILEL